MTQNISCIKRKNVSRQQINPFNTFEYKYYFIENGTTELIHRNTFMNGDVKITIGNKMTIFV